MPAIRLRVLVSASVAFCGYAAWAMPVPSEETIEQALCRLIDQAASRSGLAPSFLTKLIWQESSFRPNVTSHAGAQGIAQFMPGTAQERGLINPFDPEQAIPKAAELLADLTHRFGNVGLAAAAYNGGPARVSAWLSGKGELPGETRSYVIALTGRPAEDWAADLRDTESPDPNRTELDKQSCQQVVAALRIPQRGMPLEAPFAPWGVQLAGNFSKERALATFARASRTYASALNGAPPMIIGTRLRYRGTRTFYRVRAPAATRQEAERLCSRIHALGGNCVALPS